MSVKSINKVILELLYMVTLGHGQVKNGVSGKLGRFVIAPSNISSK